MFHDINLNFHELPHPQNQLQPIQDPIHPHVSHTTYTQHHPHAYALAGPSSPSLALGIPLLPSQPSYPNASYNNRNRGMPYSYIVFPYQSHPHTVVLKGGKAGG